MQLELTEYNYDFLIRFGEWVGNMALGEDDDGAVDRRP